MQARLDAAVGNQVVVNLPVLDATAELDSLRDTTIGLRSEIGGLEQLVARYQAVAVEVARQQADLQAGMSFLLTIAIQQ